MARFGTDEEFNKFLLHSMGVSPSLIKYLDEHTNILSFWNIGDVYKDNYNLKYSDESGEHSITEGYNSEQLFKSALLSTETDLKELMQLTGGNELFGDDLFEAIQASYEGIFTDEEIAEYYGIPLV